jgi:hypothetical protein
MSSLKNILKKRVLHYIHHGIFLSEKFKLGLGLRATRVDGQGQGLPSEWRVLFWL